MLSNSSESPFNRYILGDNEVGRIQNFCKIINRLYENPQEDIDKTWCEKFFNIKIESRSKIQPLKSLFKIYYDYMHDEERRKNLETWFGVNIFEKLFSLVSYYLVMNSSDNIKILCESLNSKIFNVDKVLESSIADRKKKLHDEQRILIDSYRSPARYSMSEFVSLDVNRKKVSDVGPRFPNSMETIIMQLLYIIISNDYNITYIQDSTYEGKVLKDLISSKKCRLIDLIMRPTSEIYNIYNLICSYIPEVYYLKSQNEVCAMFHNIYIIVSHLIKPQDCKERLDELMKEHLKIKTEIESNLDKKLITCFAHIIDQVRMKHFDYKKFSDDYLINDYNRYILENNSNIEFAKEDVLERMPSLLLLDKNLLETVFSDKAKNENYIASIKMLEDSAKEKLKLGPCYKLCKFK